MSICWAPFLTMKTSEVRLLSAVLGVSAALATILVILVMSEAGNGSEEPRRRVVMPAPATVAAFATTAGIDVDVVVRDLASMGIHARAEFLMPKEVLQTLGAKHKLEIEFVRPRRN